MSSGIPQHRIILVTGNVQGGKTTFLSELVPLLRKRGLKVAGFLCPGSFDSEGRSGFTLKNIGTGEEVLMASIRITPGWIKYRRFWFNPEAMKRGKEWVMDGLQQDPDIVVIDEVGPMELEGSGWSETMETLSNSQVPLQLWSVRERVHVEVIQKWNIAPGNLLRIEKMGAIEAAEQIYGSVKNNRGSNQT